METNIVYYESHVTIEPVFEDRLALARAGAREYGFRVAELLMQKRKEDTPERSQFDTFATGRDRNETELRHRMERLCCWFAANNFKVWRYKIEAVLLDVRIRNGN